MNEEHWKARLAQWAEHSWIAYHSRHSATRAVGAEFVSMVDAVGHRLDGMDPGTPVLVSARDPIAVMAWMWACLSKRRWIAVSPAADLQRQRNRHEGLLRAIGPCIYVDGSSVTEMHTPGGSTPALRADDVGQRGGLLQATSGTTGDPKLLAVPSAVLAEHLQAIAGQFEDDGRDAVITTVPLYHDLGLIGGALAPMAHGNPVALVSPAGMMMKPKVLWDACRELEPAVVVSVPFMLDRACGDAGWQVAQQPRDVVVGGEVLTASQPDGWFDIAGTTPCIRNSYGMAEATLMVSQASGHKTESFAGLPYCVDQDARLASVGAPIPGVSVAVEPLDGAEWGEITVTSKYSAYDWQSGRPIGPITTGDVGIMRDGELYPLGRFGDLLTVAGVTVNLVALEQRIKRLPGVHDVAVIDARATDEASAAVLVVCSRGATQCDVLPQVGECARQAIGRQVEIVPVKRPDIARTTSGKLRRVETFRRWTAATPQPA